MPSFLKKNNLLVKEIIAYFETPFRQEIGKKVSNSDSSMYKLIFPKANCRNVQIHTVYLCCCFVIVIHERYFLGQKKSGVLPFK